MAEFEYASLKSEKYAAMSHYKIVIYVDGTKMVGDGVKSGLTVTEMDIDMTSGYEASVATVTIKGVYDTGSELFTIGEDQNKMKMISLGADIYIKTGYEPTVRGLFYGFIARINFIKPPQGQGDGYIELTAMDMKGAMMVNRHSKKLTSKYYSDAVREILEGNTFYMSNKDSMEINIQDTPDKPQGAQGSDQEGAGNEKTDDRRIEMVEESEYEFVVKAAKKYNYEFFIVGPVVYFLQSKSNDSILMELTPDTDVFSYEVGYDITGMVNSVEVRNVTMEKGEAVGKTNTDNAKDSLNNKNAKDFVKNQSLVYLDPTADSQEEAGYRASYLMEHANYTMGNLKVTMQGVPEVIPGRFIVFKNFGQIVSNTFYLTRVRHVIGPDGYRMELEGCANKMGS